MIPGLVGLDITPLGSGHAIRGIGRYVAGILDALLSTQPDWCREHLAVVLAGGQDAPSGVRAAWRSRRASLRPQDIGWMVAAVADRALLRGTAVSLWHETDPEHPLGLGASERAMVTAYDLIPALEPEIMARMRRHRRVAYQLYLRRLQRARSVLAISHTTATDLHTLLGVASDRISVVYPAVVDLRAEGVNKPARDRCRHRSSSLVCRTPTSVLTWRSRRSPHTGGGAAPGVSCSSATTRPRFAPGCANSRRPAGSPATSNSGTVSATGNSKCFTRMACCWPCRLVRDSGCPRWSALVGRPGRRHPKSHLPRSALGCTDVQPRRFVRGGRREPPRRRDDDGTNAGCG